MDKLFTDGQIKRLGLIGAVQHFYTAVNLQYKNNTSAKLNDEVADIYEKATGEIVSRNWACGHCAFELFRKAGIIYYKSVERQEVKDAERKTESDGPKRVQGTGSQKRAGKEGKKGSSKTEAEGIS